jgi:pyruvate,water dikinase
LDDHALEAHLADAVDTAHAAIRHHFHLIPLYTVPPYALVQACRELLSWSEPEALGLLAGTSTKSSAPARALAELAGCISRNPQARTAVELGGDVAARLTGADPALGELYADWHRRYALRLVNSDPGSPVFAEQPWLIDGLIRDAVRAHSEHRPSLESRTDASRTRTAERARAALADRTAREKERFETALRTALRYYPLREDTVFWLAQIGGAARLAVLEAGRRLVDRGAISTAEDAVQLDLTTLRAALTGSLKRNLRDQVARAHAERAWVAHHPGPAFVGPPPGAMPDIRGLPAPARRLNAALLWAQPKPPQPVPDPAAALTGAPGSSGSYTGPVRVVRGGADFASLRPGEVLVAPTTDPAWSVLFGVAGALVTDGGGVLSHAAIVAREHAIPAVVGTASATTTLSDGEVVTVDGTTGRVFRKSIGGAPAQRSFAAAADR